MLRFHIFLAKFHIYGRRCNVRMPHERRSGMDKDKIIQLIVETVIRNIITMVFNFLWKWIKKLAKWIWKRIQEVIQKYKENRKRVNVCETLTLGTYEGTSTNASSYHKTLILIFVGSKDKTRIMIIFIRFN